MSNDDSIWNEVVTAWSTAPDSDGAEASLLQLTDHEFEGLIGSLSLGKKATARRVRQTKAKQQQQGKNSHKPFTLFMRDFMR